VFKPAGGSCKGLDQIVLTLDELESLRLADLQGLYQEQAAGQMSVSRQTFGRIIELAHRKIADVLVNGKTLKIEGGQVQVGDAKPFVCQTCSKAVKIANARKVGTGCSRCPKRA
jgi:predicted DNA-binding protein (UPF0251 family)